MARRRVSTARSGRQSPDPASRSLRCQPRRRSILALAILGPSIAARGGAHDAAEGGRERAFGFVAERERDGADALPPLGKTVGGVNMDVLNVNGATRDFEITGAGKSELEDMVKPLLAAQGRAIVAEATPEKGHYYRSDHFSFAKLGVPMLSGGSGEDLVNGGVAAGRAAAKPVTGLGTEKTVRRKFFSSRSEI